MNTVYVHCMTFYYFYSDVIESRDFTVIFPTSCRVFADFYDVFLTTLTINKGQFSTSFYTLNAINFLSILNVPVTICDTASVLLKSYPAAKCVPPIDTLFINDIGPT